jgi:hypothetical protein
VLRIVGTELSGADRRADDEGLDRCRSHDAGVGKHKDLTKPSGRL